MEEQDAKGPDEERIREAALVKAICNRVRERKNYWSEPFRRMRQYRAFARKGADADWNGAVVNIAARTIRDWTSSLYARNPKTIYRRRERMDFKVWDGTAKSLEDAKMVIAAAGDPTVVPLAPPSRQQVEKAMAVIEDASSGLAQHQLFDRIGRTATLLYEYWRDEQRRPGRQPMKKVIRRGLISGVAYIKPDYERTTDVSPEGKLEIADIQRRLQEVQRRARDVKEGDLTPEDPEFLEMQQAIARIEQEDQVVIREGLRVHYPESTAIIPDEGLCDLDGFEGCTEVAEEFIMTREEAEATWSVKIKSATAYARDHHDRRPMKDGTDFVTVWEVWNRATGLVHTVCDGHDEFLVKDFSPPIFSEHFFPWISFIPNPSDDPDQPYPISMIELICDPCMEINRSQQLLADTRYAARPGTAGTGAISTKDARKISTRTANSHVTLESLDPNRPIGDQIVAFPSPTIDPNVFDISPNIRAIELATGTSEARLEPTSRVSATAVSISESSHSSNIDSIRDELDDKMNELARRCGQILMVEMTEAEVKRIVGPGALWPEADMATIAEELFLETEFGSSGFPNQAQRVATLRDMAPLLMQIPGVVPERLAQKILEVVDQNMALDDFIDPSVTTSINGMNAQVGATQGGADNAPKPPGPASTEPAVVA